MTERALVQRSDVWIWVLVVAATVSVVALAVVQGNRSSALAGARPVSEVTLPRLGGGKLALPLGKVTMVDFWATWCAPCRASMPRVQNVWQEYRASGVEIYSVDTDDPSPDREAQVAEFLMRNRLSFPVVLDDGTAERAFQVANLPTMLLLDRQGKIVWTHVGALNAPRERELRAALDLALGR